MERRRKTFVGESKTKQSHRDECDINLIMKRFKKIQGADFLSQFNGYVGGEFGDFSIVTDYRSALEQIAKGKAVFDALPAKVRARFRNDAALFLDFVQDPRNGDELVAMGLANKRNDVKEAVKPEGVSG